jgi:hypothetical protein
MLRALPLVAVVVAAPALAAPRVEKIDLVERGDAVDVVVTASEPLTFQSWTRGTPATIVLDLLDATADDRTIAGRGAVSSVQVSHADAGGARLTRVSLPLSVARDYDVTARGNAIVVAVVPPRTRAAAVELRNDGAAPVKIASAAAVVEGSMGRATATDAVLLAQAAPTTKQMTYIGFKNAPAQSRVFVRLNDAAEYAVKKEGDNILVLEIKGATIPLRNNKNHLDTTFFDSPVKMITPSEVEDAVPTIRVTIEMKAAVPYEAKLEGKEIAIYFKK